MPSLPEGKWVHYLTEVLPMVKATALYGHPEDPDAFGREDAKPTTVRGGQDRRHSRWQRVALLPDRRAVLRGSGAAAGRLRLGRRPGGSSGFSELRHGRSDALFL